MTPQQKKLHDFLWERRDGVMPTLDEMAEHMGLKAKSGVCRLIDRLEELGLVKRAEKHRARSLTVLPPRGVLDTFSDDALAAELRRRGWNVPFDQAGTVTRGDQA